MNDDWEDGMCDMCAKKKPIRFKNLYWNGSEGLWCCIECERTILAFVRERINERIRAKVRIILDKKFK